MTESSVVVGIDVAKAQLDAAVVGASAVPARTRRFQALAILANAWNTRNSKASAASGPRSIAKAR